MMRTLLTITLSALFLFSFGQARLVINNDAYIVLDAGTSYANGSWLVVGNGNANAIATTGTGGNIVSEGEFNLVRWNIGNTGGPHTVPFTNNLGTKIPLTVTPTGASLTGSFVFSTYVGPTWDNTGYMPSDVTHMNDWTTGAPNNSNYVVDRFWIADTEAPSYAYTAKPSVNYTFTFDPVDDMDNNAGNMISSASHDLGAQRFNTGPQQWGDFLPIGVDGGTTVVTGVIGTADIFRSWTLVEKSNPLPIELVSFEAQCNENHVVLKWTTATEQDNDYFTIEKSLDGYEFDVIGTMPGAGNSIGELNYSFIDDQPAGVAYYRLLQTDFDGTSTNGPTVATDCEATGGIDIVNAWDDGNMLHLTVSSSSEHVLELTMLDSHGKQMLSAGGQSIQKGITEILIPKNDIATGMYMLRLHNDQELLSRKIVLR